MTSSPSIIHPWVVDDFYAAPDRVRAHALRMPFRQVPGFAGWRTPPHHARGIRSRLARALGVSVVGWSTDRKNLAFGNGSFFKGFSVGPYADPVAVHVDTPTDYLTTVVDLTPNPPRDSGTSFWQHRETGLVAAPTPADSRRLGATVAELAARLNREGQLPEKWIEVARVENRCNRAVAFPSGVLHSATRHFGRTLNGGRLYQSFRFAYSGALGKGPVGGADCYSPTGVV